VFTVRHGLGALNKSVCASTLEGQHRVLSVTSKNKVLYTFLVHQRGQGEVLQYTVV